ncbi:hypothetical protein D9M69_332860 [compost metagenome]
MANIPLSAEFRELETRYRTLRRKFLARECAAEKKDPIGFTPDVDKLAAFQLLFHAEVEDYLERKARAKLSQIEHDISANVRVIDRLDWYALACHFEVAISIEVPHDRLTFQTKATEIITKGRKFVKDNNGIKSASFAVLSLLAGKRTSEIDDNLAAQLTTYGSDRGDIAHQSTVRVRTINAPSAYETSSSALLAAIKQYFYRP